MIAVNLYDGVLTVIVSYNSVKIGLMYLYMFIYLTAKETHIFNIHLIPETLIKCYPN